MAHVGGAAGRLGGVGVRGALVRGGLHDQFIYKGQNPSQLFENFDKRIKQIEDT